MKSLDWNHSGRIDYSGKLHYMLLLEFLVAASE
jgi:hypothetical protein